MRSNHTGKAQTRWSQEVHKPIRWFCDLNHEKPQLFPNQQDLKQHLLDRHSDSFESSAEILALILDQSSMPALRELKVCPLCENVPDTLEQLINAKDLPYETQGQPGPSPMQISRDSTQGASSTSKGTQLVTRSDVSVDKELLYMSKLEGHIAEHLRELAFISIRNLDELYDQIPPSERQELGEEQDAWSIGATGVSAAEVFDPFGDNWMSQGSDQWIGLPVLNRPWSTNPIRAPTRQSGPKVLTTKSHKRPILTDMHGFCGEDKDLKVCFCGDVFQSIDALNSHILQRDEARNRCGFCNLYFRVNADLRSHVESQHLQKNPMLGKTQPADSDDEGPAEPADISGWDDWLSHITLVLPLKGTTKRVTIQGYRDSTTSCALVSKLALWEAGYPMIPIDATYTLVDGIAVRLIGMVDLQWAEIGEDGEVKDRGTSRFYVTPKPVYNHGICVNKDFSGPPVEQEEPQFPEPELLV